MPFLVFVAPRVTASLHPQTVINPQGKILMDAPTKAVFFGALFGFSGLFLWMLSLEARAARLARRARGRQPGLMRLDQVSALCPGDSCSGPAEGRD